MLFHLKARNVQYLFARFSKKTHKVKQQQNSQYFPEEQGKFQHPGVWQTAPVLQCAGYGTGYLPAALSFHYNTPDLRDSCYHSDIFL